MVERHLPLIIHLPARILALRRFLSLDRQRKESEEELKDVCSFNRFVMNLKDLPERTHLVLDFSSISILICLWKIVEHSSQSSQISLHVSFEIVKLFSKHSYPSGVFQPRPTSSYNVLLLLPYLRACR